MTKYLMVGLGGCLGSMLRYWMGGYVGNRFGTRFPYGTFIVNCTASFLIGLIVTLLAEKTQLERELALPDSHRLHRRVHALFPRSNIETFRSLSGRRISDRRPQRHPERRRRIHLRLVGRDHRTFHRMKPQSSRADGVRILLKSCGLATQEETC